MDDISFAGSLMGATAGLDMLERKAPDYGLKLKGSDDPLRTKLKLFAPCCDVAWTDPEGDGPDLSANHSRLATITAEAFSRLKSRHFAISKDGIRRVLGAPLSLDPRFVTGWLQERVDSSKVLLSRISLLNDPASEWLMLKYCGSTRLLHLCRMLYPDDLHFPLIDCRDAMRSCFNHIVGAEVTPHEWDQVLLPTRHGGCGLIDPVRIRPAAALASASRTAHLLAHVRDATSNNFYSKMLSTLEKQPYLAVAAAQINSAAVEVGACTDTFLPPLSALHSSKWPAQRELSNVFHLQRKHTLLADLSALDLTKAAWLRSCALFGSGQWLHTVPMLPCFQCTKDEFQMMMRNRLMVDAPLASAVHIPVCACGIDHSHRIQSGSHYHSSCNKVSLLRTARHDDIRDCICKAAREAEIRARIEPNGLVGGASNARPADVLIPPHSSAGVRGCDRSLDVVICDPRKQDNVSNGSHAFSLVASTEADAKKLSEHNHVISRCGPGIIPVEKIPLSFESSGAWGVNMIALWKELKITYKCVQSENYIRQDKPHTWTAFTYAQFWPQRISFAISKYTAQMVIAGLASSRRFACVV
jgi:hypothetical protein